MSAQLQEQSGRMWEGDKMLNFFFGVMVGTFLGVIGMILFAFSEPDKKGKKVNK